MHFITTYFLLGFGFFSSDLAYTCATLIGVHCTGFRSFCTHFTNSLRFTACSTRCRPLLWLIFYSQYILSPPRANILVYGKERERGANKPKWYYHWVFQQILGVYKCIFQCNTPFSWTQYSLKFVHFLSQLCHISPTQRF